MKTLCFREWMAKTPEDMYGFDHDPAYKKRPDENEDPVERFHVEAMLKELVHQGKVGTKRPKHTWHDMVEWGDGPGQMQLDVSPFGSFKAVVRRRTADLEGADAWICKKVFPLVDMPDHSNGDTEEVAVAQAIHEAAQEIEKSPLDSPKPAYPELEALVMHLADDIRRRHPEVMVFEGVKRASENKYIIYLAYRGHGVEAPGAQRCEQFNVEMNWLPDRGLLRCIGHEIVSPTRQHKWEIGLPEWDELFAPTQDRREVVDCVAKILSTY